MNTQNFAALLTALSSMDDAQLNTLLVAVGATPAPTQVSEPRISFPEEKSPNRPELFMVGDKKWQEDFCTVTYVKANNRYRLYITCPVKGKKGESIRYAIKASAKKDYGAKWAGDFDKHDIYWEFPTKKAAEGFIKARKEYAEKVEKK